MIQVKVEVHAGSSGEGWAVELERSQRVIQRMDRADLDEVEAARDVLRKLYQEADRLLAERLPAGPPKPVPCCLDKR